MMTGKQTAEMNALVTKIQQSMRRHTIKDILAIVDAEIRRTKKAISEKVSQEETPYKEAFKALGDQCDLLLKGLREKIAELSKAGG